MKKVKFTYNFRRYKKYSEIYSLGDISEIIQISVNSLVPKCLKGVDIETH